MNMTRMFVGGALAACLGGAASGPEAQIPDPLLDTPLAKSPAEQTAVLAGGCFWGMEAVFQHVKGVKEVVSGYAGGEAKDARYDIVSSGRTGHAEAVRIVFDPSQVSYGRLLKIFFAVAHDPTQLNRQGPDVGPQYRSAIFYADAEQKQISEAYIAQLDRAGIYREPIATRTSSLTAFYPAEEYHQNYLARHPNSAYIVIHDLPKLQRLKKIFPASYRPDNGA